MGVPSLRRVEHPRERPHMLVHLYQRMLHQHKIIWKVLESYIGLRTFRKASEILLDSSGDAYRSPRLPRPSHPTQDISGGKRSSTHSIGKDNGARRKV
eukprot:1394636-Amorphochlora_amoeboformis.AAC.1